MDSQNKPDEFTQRLLTWLSDYNAFKAATTKTTTNSMNPLPNKPEIPPWVHQELQQPPPPPPLHPNQVPAFHLSQTHMESQLPTQQVHPQGLEDEEQDQTPSQEQLAAAHSQKSFGTMDQMTARMNLLSVQDPTSTTANAAVSILPAAGPSPRFIRSQQRLQQPWRRTSAENPLTRRTNPSKRPQLASATSPSQDFGQDDSNNIYRNNMGYSNTIMPNHGDMCNNSGNSSSSSTHRVSDKNDTLMTTSASYTSNIGTTLKNSDGTDDPSSTCSPASASAAAPDSACSSSSLSLSLSSSLSLASPSSSSNTFTLPKTSTSASTLPHDILLAILSHLQPRANAQQYYDPTQPSDLLACSRVNMAWRLAALSSIWQTIALPDPFDRSCRRLLHLLASSHAMATLTNKSYNITEIIQRVEVDLLEATELTDSTPYMTQDISAILQFISPFRTLSIQLPQEIEFKAAEILAAQTSVPLLEAITLGVTNAKIRELDMPSPMYCSVPTFPGMLRLISSLKSLRVLVLGYSSRDWPLLRAIISLPLLESLCVFDSCWSNQIWIYLLSSLGPRLRHLTILQGRRPIQGVVLREGIAPFCRNLTSLWIPFIPLLAGPGPVLTNEDVIPILKACHELQSINLAGQRRLSDPVLLAMADLWGLQTLDIRDCDLMSGQSVKGVRWQSIQRVRMAGCAEMSQEFMDVIMQAWRNGSGGTSTSAGKNNSNSRGVVHSPSSSSSSHQRSHPQYLQRHHHHHRPIGSSTSGVGGGGPGSSSRRMASVLDFNTDNPDPVEMGWVRQREEEPPLDIDEDHFFADWYS
ncbi:hypothetical protein BG004_005025 [Podila humilis]|nr:hypothetical protein BG004_005025 [Podila humilis]